MIMRNTVVTTELKFRMINDSHELIWLWLSLPFFFDSLQWTFNYELVPLNEFLIGFLVNKVGSGYKNY